MHHALLEIHQVQLEKGHIFIPAINIGTRQNKRLRGKNVIDVRNNSAQIINAIKKQIKVGKYKSQNIYGNGTASKKIVKILKRSKILIFKNKFILNHFLFYSFMTFLAYVPARKNSKRLKNKNTKLLNGKPLIMHTLYAAQKVNILKIFIFLQIAQILKEFVLKISLIFLI